MRLRDGHPAKKVHLSHMFLVPRVAFLVTLAITTIYTVYLQYYPTDCSLHSETRIENLFKINCNIRSFHVQHCEAYAAQGWPSRQKGAPFTYVPSTKFYVLGLPRKHYNIYRIFTILSDRLFTTLGHSI